MNLFATGISYKTARLEQREKLAVSRSRLGCAGCRLKIAGDLSEVVVVSTCNRVEIYGTTPHMNGQLDSLFRELSPDQDALEPYLYENEEAVRYLFSVTSGLDSMVLGETEITGQIKHAYETARAWRLTGGVLNRLFQKALQTAKEVRTNTGIGRGTVSVGSVALALAEKIFGDGLPQRTVMIIGAGKMGEACVRHLAKKSTSTVLVSNRSFERAQAVAERFSGRAVRLEDSFGALTEADIVVSSTGSPDTILHRAQVESALRARGRRPLVLIDIAVPRDIDPEVQHLENVYLYNIDDLESVVREQVRRRKHELEKCRVIIDKRTAEVIDKLTTVPRKRYDHHVQSQPGWVFRGAALGCS